MRRRSNWPLIAILLAAAAVQAGLSWTRASSLPAAGSNSVVRDGYICTACGPIATGIASAKETETGR
jgi:hypothetical protein